MEKALIHLGKVLSKTPKDVNALFAAAKLNYQLAELGLAKIKAGQGGTPLRIKVKAAKNKAKQYYQQLIDILGSDNERGKKALENLQRVKVLN